MWDFKYNARLLKYKCMYLTWSGNGNHNETGQSAQTMQLGCGSIISKMKCLCSFQKPMLHILFRAH